MKRGAKFLVKVGDGPACGPFRWTVVREWVALGSLRPDDEVRSVEDAAWCPIGRVPELMAPPPPDEKNEGLTQVRARALEQKAVGPRAAAYLNHLGCPVPLSRLNPYTAFQWVRILEELSPQTVNNTEHWAANEESNDRVPSASPADATPEQIATLRASGHVVTGKLSRQEAQRLIAGPPSAGQLRRLAFYGLTLPPGAGKDEAADLIDRHMREHWETEEAYQASKQRLVAEAAERQKPSLPATPASAPGAEPRPAAPKLTPKAAPAAATSTPSGQRPSALRIVTVFGLLALAVLAVAWSVAQRRRGVAAGQPDFSSPTLTGTEAAQPNGLPTSLAEAELPAYVMALKLTGIFGGPEPRASIDGRMYRVGDVIDRPRGIVIVYIDADKPSVVFGDAKKNIFERVLN